MIIRRLPRHTVSIALGSYGLWVLLTWTLTLEVLVAGAIVALMVTAATVPLVRDTRRLTITPRRIFGVMRLIAFAAGRIVGANLQLARRIWSPSLPVRTGMVTVPTKTRTDAGAATVGIVTSLIVDNQIVDVDRSRNEMLYHAVVVPEGDESAYDAINGPIDSRVAALETARD